MAATTALIIVGNEILSGKTRDANTPWIAQQLAARGLRLSEVRVIADIEAEIIATVNALRTKYDFIFTTGGIGPTHDDITSECVSRAFGLPHVINPEAKRRLQAYYDGRGIELNAARLRMATLPEGASLLDNPISAAPGFRIGNVFVMAGIPAVMQEMWKMVEPQLPTAPPVQSRTVNCSLAEGDLAADLSAIQKDYPDIDIGSYPVSGDKGFSVSLVLTGSDQTRLDAATLNVEAMVARLSNKEKKA